MGKSASQQEQEEEEEEQEQEQEEGAFVWSRWNAHLQGDFFTGTPQFQYQKENRESANHRCCSSKFCAVIGCLAVFILVLKKSPLQFHTVCNLLCEASVQVAKVGGETSLKTTCKILSILSSPASPYWVHLETAIDFTIIILTRLDPSCTRVG